MSRKFKIITSICTIVMSTFVAIPTSAVSPPKNKKTDSVQYVEKKNFQVQNPQYRHALEVAKQRINNLFYRINKAEQATKNESFELQDELKNIKSRFQTLNNLNSDDQSQFASLAKEEFDQKILEYQNIIDEIQNNLDRLEIKLNKTVNNQINSKLLDECMSNISNYCNEKNMKKLRLDQFNNRLLQFKYRTDYCQIKIENMSKKSNQKYENGQSKDLLSDISSEFNSYLNSINNNLSQLENLNILHDTLNYMHSTLTNLNARLNFIEDSFNIKQHRKKVALTLKSATAQNAMIKKNEIKKLADEAMQNDWPRNWIKQYSSTPQNTKPYVLTLISYYKKTAYIPKKCLFIEKYQKHLPEFFFNKKYLINHDEPYYRVKSRDVIAEKSEDQKENSSSQEHIA